MRWHDFEMKLTLGIQTFEIKLNVKQMRTVYTPCEILEIWTRQYRSSILVLIMQYVEHYGKIIKIPYGCPFEGWSERHLFWQLALCLFSTGPKKDSVTVFKSFLHNFLLCTLLAPHTGCVRQNENPTRFKIVKEPLPIQNQTINQQKALDFSFNLTYWNWL